MTQAQRRYLNRLLDFWNAADAELAKRGEPPLIYERARELFDLEIDPNIVPDAIVIAPVAKEAAQ